MTEPVTRAQWEQVRRAGEAFLSGPFWDLLQGRLHEQRITQMRRLLVLTLSGKQGPEVGVPAGEAVALDWVFAEIEGMIKEAREKSEA